MFTLCMSRGPPSVQEQDAHIYNNCVPNKQIKGGYLLRYRRGFFCKRWREEWFVLYEDSTLEWYAEKGLSRPRGRIRISEAPELLAVGEWTRQVPRRPPFPHSCHIGQLLAIGSRIPQDVQWLMAQSPAEVNDWMTAISNTLPPPPHLPLDNKRLSLTPEREVCQYKNATCANGPCCPKAAAATAAPGSANKNNKVRNQQNNYDADHTVLAGVAIDWGHGWGWGQNAMAIHSGWGSVMHSACAAEAAMSSALYCHALGDYTVNGFDDVDWSAFSDFTF